MPLPLCPTCPAAAKIAGACGSQEGVVCRVMQTAHKDDPGLNMTAGQSGFIQNEADGGVYLNLKSDPSTVVKFCHGDALPVLHDGTHLGGRASYTYCPTWQAERARIEDGRKQLLEDPEPESVAAGVTVNPLEDPFQAHRDLEELAA